MADVITENLDEELGLSVEAGVVMMGAAPATRSANEPLDSHELVQAHYRLAKVLYDKCDLRLAQSHFEQALRFAQKPRDIFILFKILGFLVRIASERFDQTMAENYIGLSERLVEEIPTHLGSLNAEYFYNSGVVNTYRGSFAQARENFQLSYQKAKEENEPEIIAKSLYALATSYAQTKNSDQALSYLDQLKELLGILDKSYMQGSLHMLYGNLYAEKEFYNQALEEFRQANKILQRKTCWNLYGYILLGKGIVYKRLGEFNKAVFYFENALDSIDESAFKRLSSMLRSEIDDVNDSTVDLYLDRTNRTVQEQELGVIDFKHRFVLLEILFLLAQNSGTYFSKEELAQAIWKDEYNPLIHDKLIYTSVSRLRKLIEPRSEKRKYILRGKDGYTFNPHAKTRFQRATDLDGSLTLGNIELTSPV